MVTSAPPGSFDQPSPSLLLVEDDPALAAITAEVLSEVYRVDQAASGEAALELALRRHYDLMVVDRRLPGLDGVSLVRAIRRAHVTTPVLLLTALGTVEQRVEGLDGGANDYLVKPFDFEELLARLRALRRGFAADGRRVHLGDWLFTPDNDTIYPPSGGRVTLTAAESALLGLLSQSPEHVFSREEILSAVFERGDTPGTVDTYVHYLRKKTCHSMVETVRSRGYRLGQPD
ncbi:MAG: response regulator transcription factor [Propionibacteriaceae bacterium]|jgi:two-component system response regulator QseB|nr:response regulator transcription factor [Propionibacteriaceae bacterium]